MFFFLQKCPAKNKTYFANIQDILNHVRNSGYHLIPERVFPFPGTRTTSPGASARARSTSVSALTHMGDVCPMRWCTHISAVFHALAF